MRNIVDASKLDLKSTIVSIRRVAKTVKGGRNMRFSVTVVVGDGNGYVGVGLGKSQEIPEAVRKAEEDAKKNLIYVPTVGTWAFSAQAEYSSCRRHKVPELSQVLPYVRYWNLRVSRTSERNPSVPTTLETWLTQHWRASRA